VTLKNLLTMENVGTLNYESILTDEGEQIVKHLSSLDMNEDLAEKVRSDLESWKERERQKLQKEVHNGVFRVVEVEGQGGILPYRRRPHSGPFNYSRCDTKHRLPCTITPFF